MGRSYHRPVIVLFFTFFLLSGLVPSTALGQETHSIAVKSVNDTGEDVNGDGTIDFLTIQAQVHVSDSGRYAIYGIIETIKTELITAHNASELREGDGVLIVKFPGAKIYESGMDGPYTINLRITNEEAHVSYIHNNTKEYSYEEFNPSGVSPSPILPLYNENLTLEFESIMQRPNIVFYPTPMGDRYRFILAFDSILGIADDGDGEYDDGDEIVVRGDLSEKSWDLSISQAGGSVRLSIRNTIDLWDVANKEPVCSVDIDFIFNTNIQGTYKKFDIELVFSKVVHGVDFFSLKHHVEDVTGTTDVERRREGGTTRVQFVNGDREEVAYYEWVDEAELYKEDWENVTLSHSYAPEKDRVALQLIYPYREGVKKIYHDPVLGTKAVDRLPGGEDMEGLENNPVIFGISLILGALFIWYTIYLQRKKE